MACDASTVAMFIGESPPFLGYLGILACNEGICLVVSVWCKIY